MDDSNPDAGGGDDLSPDEIEGKASEIAGQVESVASGDPDAGGVEPAEEQARRELRDPLKLVDAMVRTASGAPVPEDMDLDMESPEDRADMAARMLAPAYQRLAGPGTLDWRLKAVIGVGVIVVPALIEGKLAGGGDGDDDQDDGPESAPLPDGVRDPSKSQGTDSGGGPDAGGSQEGAKLSVGAQAGGE